MLQAAAIGISVGILYFVARIYLVFPMSTRTSHVIDLRRGVRVIQPDVIPVAMRSFIEETVPALTECGFAFAGYFCQTITGKGSATAYVALWFNRSTAQAATVVGMHSEGKAGADVLRYVEFSTTFADGLVINTGNSRRLSGFKSAVVVDAIMAASVRDVRTLHNLHLSREARLRPATAMRYCPSTTSNLRAWFADELLLSLIRQEEAGYFTVAKPGAYRPTWRGAFMMTWGLLPPFKQIRAARMRRRAKAAIAAMEAQPPASPRNVPITHESPYAEKIRAAKSTWPPEEPAAPDEPVVAAPPVAGAAAPPQAPGRQATCPFCMTALPIGAIVCESCGYDTQTGRVVKPGPGRAGSVTAAAGGAGTFLLGAFLSALAVLIGAAAWGAIWIWTGYELGIVAWAVGGLAGFGMWLGCRKAGVKGGVVAAGTATLGIGAAKVVCFMFMVYILVTGNTDNIRHLRMFVTRHVAEELFAERGAWSYEERKAQMAEVEDATQARIDAMSDDEVRAKAAEYRATLDPFAEVDAPTDEIQWQREALAERLADRRLEREDTSDDEERWQTVHDEELARVTVLSDDELREEEERLDALEKEEDRWFRLAHHASSRRADGQGLSRDDEKREALYEEESARYKAMPDAEVEAELEKLDAWEAGGKWADAAYVRDFLIYAATDRAREEAAADEGTPEEWQASYEAGRAEVDAIPADQRVARAQQVEAEQTEAFERLMQQYREETEASQRQALGQAVGFFLSTVFRGTDILFILLAIGTAYKVGSGRARAA
ncbi:MAG: hypothetical protein JXA69_05515 [Phycisphaerae bacterium]|nr:hypothetical protein [Phycisphaerae bacterium]